MNFVFDVDGTLTDSRQQIDKEFLNFMQKFTGMHTCYLCTGSDRKKTVEQLGTSLTNKFSKAFHCSGNLIYSGNKEIHRSPWALTSAEYAFLEQALDNINYSEPTGNHIEERIGTANVSIVGRNCNLEQRKRFVRWDIEHNARDMLATQFNLLFPKSQAIVGGETGIDIFKAGHDKSQIRAHITGDIIYFGDKCFPGGNDYPISSISEKFYQIDHGWQQTFEILKNEYI
jgi:phosphomannomutase